MLKEDQGNNMNQQEVQNNNEKSFVPDFFKKSNNNQSQQGGSDNGTLVGSQRKLSDNRDDSSQHTDTNNIPNIKTDGNIKNTDGKVLQHGMGMSYGNNEKIQQKNSGGILKKRSNSIGHTEQFKQFQANLIQQSQISNNGDEKQLS